LACCEEALTPSADGCGAGTTTLHDIARAVERCRFEQRPSERPSWQPAVIPGPSSELSRRCQSARGAAAETDDDWMRMRRRPRDCPPARTHAR